jgi:hypothetical protein
MVTLEMERLVPGKGKWLVEEIAGNTIKTLFPSRRELHRMIEWGVVETMDRKTWMIMEEDSGCYLSRH